MKFFSSTISFLAVFCLAAAESKLFEPLTDSFINEINNAQNLWTAGRNFHKETPESFFKNRLGVLDDGKRLPIKSLFLNKTLPVNFDAREKWTNCPSIKEISDQGSCASDWAVAAVGAMSDRTCIRSKGKKQVRLSADDLLTCCKFCGNGNGCNGGNLEKTWAFWAKEGVVTGGEYGSNEGCRPYQFPPCEHYMDGTRPACGEKPAIPSCSKTCIGNPSLTYETSKSYGDESYALPENDKWIREDIYDLGPVEASFTVYEDWLSYKDGIYQHVKGEEMGKHAVRIIGWGEENDTPYWLVANSWNTDWGNNGLFKILRGSNECDIESHVIAGFAI